MNVRRLVSAIAFLIIVPLDAHADYHSVLIGVRLHLSTSEVPLEISSAVVDANGVTQVTSLGQSNLNVPDRILDGYLVRISADPDLRNLRGSAGPALPISPSALSQNGKFSFVPKTAIVRLKYPRAGLAQTGFPRGLFISTEIVANAERAPGQFDGDAEMGEPFFVLPREAELLSSKPPVFSCDASGEGQSAAWVSYNPEVGEAELSPFCAVLQDYSGAAPLVKKGNVFLVSYPYD